MCPDKEIISAFIDDEVENDFCTIIKNHIDSCKACKCVADSYIALRTSFQKAAIKNNEVEAAQERVWSSIKNIPPKPSLIEVWNKKILIPLPAMAAALMFIVFSAFLSFYFLLNDGKINNSSFVNQIKLSESVIVDKEEDFLLFEKDHILDVDLQLPESAIFTVSDSPKLIREIDYNAGGRK